MLWLSVLKCSNAGGEEPEVAGCAGDIDTLLLSHSGLPLSLDSASAKGVEVVVDELGNVIEYPESAPRQEWCSMPGKAARAAPTASSTSFSVAVRA
jgi:hypothetical protein